MPYYKVLFIGNMPVTAAEISPADFRSLREFDTSSGNTQLKWYIVQAENVQRAMELAATLAKRIWGDLLAR